MKPETVNLETVFRDLERQHRAGDVSARDKAINLLMLVSVAPPSIRYWYWIMEDVGLTPRQKKALRAEQEDSRRARLVMAKRAQSKEFLPLSSKNRDDMGAWKEVAKDLGKSEKAVEKSWSKIQKLLKKTNRSL